MGGWRDRDCQGRGKEDEQEEEGQEMIALRWKMAGEAEGHGTTSPGNRASSAEGEQSIHRGGKDGGCSGPLVSRKRELSAADQGVVLQRRWEGWAD